MLRVMPQKQDEPHDWTTPATNWAEEQARRVALEVRRLRVARKWSAQALSARTDDLGSAVSRAVISDLEVGRRRYVTVSELMILARALDTAPIALLYPFPYYNEGKIQVLPTPEGVEGHESEKIDGVQWFTGVLNILPLGHLGISMVDQANYFSQLQGLERARKIFDLHIRNEKLSVRVGLLRGKKRDGDATVSDEDIDELVAEIEDNQGRIDYLLSLGDRDLHSEQFEAFFSEHVSKGDGG